MSETLITWNVTNWVTIVLMGALGFLVFTVIAKTFHKSTGNRYAVGAVGQPANAIPSGALGSGFTTN